MPELPEVETVVRGLRQGGLVGRRIEAVRVHWKPTVSAPEADAFARALAGRRVAGVSRRAKYIVVALSGDRHLLIHLRMTGQLHFAPAGAPRDRHEHVVLGLDDGRELRFRDTRKFGRWWLTADPRRDLAALGPEPLSAALTAEAFLKRLAGRRGMLKPLLLNQRFLAGLGNIYVDEALWEARLHPRRRAETLRRADGVRLHGAIRRVLRRAIAAGGTTLGRGRTTFQTPGGGYGRNKRNLQVFRRTGEACPRCGAAVRRIIVGQRGTHICPRCQRG